MTALTVKRRFTVALWLMTSCGLAWVFTHFEKEDFSALKGWISAMAGDADLKLKTRDFIRGGLMLAALSWIATGAALLLTRHWWCRDLAEKRADKPIWDRSFLIGVGCLVLLALMIRLPRMDLGLYNDEIDVFRTSIAGSFDREAAADWSKSDAVPFRPTPWTETLWGNRIGNNHSLHSVLARVGYDLWHVAAGAVPGQIREWPLRLPALIGGLISIVAAAGLARQATGSARAGLFVAFVLAVHPWHVRYSTEARGYGLVFGFAGLAVLFLALSLKRGCWRWWLAFGASQACCLWACFGSLYFVAALNGVAVALMIWGRKRSDPVASETIPCWIVATVLSAALYLLLAAPILPPIRLALMQNTTFQAGVPPHWWPDVLSYLFLGMPWFDHDPGNAINPATVKVLANPLLWAGGIAATIAAAAGMWRLWKQGGAAGRLAVAPALIAVLVQWAVSALTGEVLLKWYVNYATVFVALWIGAGFDGWVRALSSAGSAWQRLMTYAFLGLYAAAVATPLIRYRSHSKQGIRDAVEYIRGGEVFPFSEEQLRPLVVGWWTHANYYDPHLRVAHTPEALQGVIDRAKKENRPLYFVLGMRDRAAAEDPLVTGRLESSGEFALERIFPGLEEAQFRTHVFRFKETQGREKSQNPP
jgi:hypothetical protein